ncbi:MAG: rhomboid family intramembrane serine protease [Gammaproteobacteria bacterium]|nr:rhomboid family intramembrane serine protease [Gammaproteobacteria bacterium]
MPPFTRALLQITIGAYLLQMLFGRALYPWFALWPGDWLAGGSASLATIWQLVTYCFLHANLTHLALNMFALWMFGSAVELAWGATGMAQVYFTSVVTGALGQIVVGGMLGQAGAPVVGASAGVFGLMMIYALLFPHRRIVLLIPPIPLPARVFVAIYAAIELALGLFGGMSSVAHFAHLGGLVGAAGVYAVRGR